MSRLAKYDLRLQMSLLLLFTGCLGTTMIVSCKGSSRGAQSQLREDAPDLNDGHFSINQTGTISKTVCEARPYDESISAAINQDMAARFGDDADTFQTKIVSVSWDPTPEKKSQGCVITYSAIKPAPDPYYSKGLSLVKDGCAAMHSAMQAELGSDRELLHRKVPGEQLQFRDLSRKCLMNGLAALIQRKSMAKLPSIICQINTTDWAPSVRSRIGNSCLISANRHL